MDRKITHNSLLYSQQRSMHSKVDFKQKRIAIKEKKESLLGALEKQYHQCHRKVLKGSYQSDYFYNKNLTG